MTSQHRTASLSHIAPCSSDRPLCGKAHQMPMVKQPPFSYSSGFAGQEFRQDSQVAVLSCRVEPPGKM